MQLNTRREKVQTGSADSRIVGPVQNHIMIDRHA
jgi:hypothetical protein